MRILAVALAALLLLMQWPLWFGKGGWLQVWQLQTELARRQAANAELAAQNAALAAEVASLRDGREAIEEHARMQLNLIRPDEVFFQFSAPSPGLGDAANVAR
ncbi:MAG: cell division protein FtsB [Sutterellaceae bacterium]|nr:cell division protein FtsB [Burkholderiaceae bacterium]MDW8428997.1 cell division protein FtsB [Sutterellaceae bacterium]